MNPWRPCKRRTFILRLKRIGFIGPFPGSRHAFMVYGQHRLSIPSNSEYSIPQLKMMISEVQEIIGRALYPEEWDQLD